MKINLIFLTDYQRNCHWEQGEVYCVPASINEIHRILSDIILLSSADFWLIWDEHFGCPDVCNIIKIAEKPGDVWHAGLKLGLGGHPYFINFVSPTWMLNRDPDPNITATSWRLSLHCCLIRSKVIQEMGGPLLQFSTMEAAGLEMGYRYIRNGVFMQHISDLLSTPVRLDPVKISLEDQLRFLFIHYGKKWTLWASLRAILCGDEKVVNIFRAYRKVRINNVNGKTGNTYLHKPVYPVVKALNAKVSVLIPTLNRYPYLRVLLGQLRNQTVKPYEILIIDQTPEPNRESRLLQEYKDLPIRLFLKDQMGQCSARNLGLQKSGGEYILFIDDDDEVPENLIELHLKKLMDLQLQISNGVAHEVGIGTLPKPFTFQRISDVFPTNNTMIRKEILKNSGLFDLAFDRGQVEDADLGMRIYLSGEVMVLSPEITVLHHHAPQGGLRQHKARVNTYTSSRQKVNLRILPSVSNIYLARRHFSPFQVREMLWIATLATFSIHGSLWSKALKAVISFIALPSTILQIKLRYKKVEEMLKIFPLIPNLSDENIDAH